ncbi:hypothetical protein [Devosia naphthalenivorans]|uniref:hypothetical protein n=1 Tax=Devosia naphthalenivorans TaxID=2082392 RepID=UPI0013B050E3|nr:hypothetical protein [Devosia naphthalenivorans]
MAYSEVPSDDEVVGVLRKMGVGISARALCDALVQAGHPRPDSQLAIQRATERGRIVVAKDWTLTASNDMVAA